MHGCVSRTGKTQPASQESRQEHEGILLRNSPSLYLGDGGCEYDNSIWGRIFSCSPPHTGLGVFTHEGKKDFWRPPVDARKLRCTARRA